MYVNKKYGYGVINDFELNRKYKHHERSSEIKYEPDDNTGRYNVPEDSKEEEERELIFKAFQRGIQAFIEEYDSQNPDNPIKQVNVGKGYNRLKRQVDRFERAIEKRTRIDDHPRGQAAAQRATSDDEAGEADRLFDTKQQPKGRDRAGRFRRQRDDADRMRAARPEVLHGGARSEILRRNHQTLGGAHRAEGGPD